ncbi:hypothetical protein A9Q99_12720 [Gammaproteobacteria bacterium 45_16_T64]|nr:hypothetical protein A9Q99_12720 [Gammaproteobacteria bacterium 45_16_T64]
MRKKWYVFLLSSGLLCSQTSIAKEHSYDEILAEYSFLQSLSVDTGDFEVIEPWRFMLEVNNSANTDRDSSAFQSILSAAKFSLLTATDSVDLSYETDGGDAYHGFNGIYDTGSSSHQSWHVEFVGDYSLSRVEIEDSGGLEDDVAWNLGAYGLYDADFSEPEGVYQWSIGARWQVLNNAVDTAIGDIEESQFLLPGFAFRWRTVSSWGESQGRLGFEWNDAGLANTETIEASALLCTSFYMEIAPACGVQIDSIIGTDDGVDFQLATAEYQYSLGFGAEAFDATRSRIVWIVSAQSSLGFPLQSYFQRSIGGLHSVRGYKEQALSGDNVIESSIEYQQRFFVGKVDLWGRIFVDWAQVETESFTIRARAVDLSVTREREIEGQRRFMRSWGGGFDIRVDQQLTLYVMWGTVLTGIDEDNEEGDSRLHGYLRYLF